MKASLSDSLGPEASFRLASSETQICQHTGSGPTEPAVFTRMPIYFIPSREPLYIFSGAAAQPELEKPSRNSMETAYGRKKWAWCWVGQRLFNGKILSRHTEEATKVKNTYRIISSMQNLMQTCLHTRNISGSNKPLRMIT